jgi:hypothetical protein
MGNNQGGQEHGGSSAQKGAGYTKAGVGEGFFEASRHCPVTYCHRPHHSVMLNDGIPASLYSRCACWISSIQDIANSLVIFLRIDFFVPFNASIAIVWAFLLRAFSTPPRMHFVTIALISIGIFSQA